MKKSRKNISGGSGMLSYFYPEPPKKRSSQRKKSSTNRFYSAESETEYTNCYKQKQKNRELIVKFIKGMNEIQKNNAENLEPLQKKLSKKRIKKPKILQVKTTKHNIISFYDQSIYALLTEFSLYNKSYKERWEALSKEYDFPLDNSCIEKEKPVRNYTGSRHTSGNRQANMVRNRKKIEKRIKNQRENKFIAPNRVVLKGKYYTMKAGFQEHLIKLYDEEASADPDDVIYKGLPLVAEIKTKDFQKTGKLDVSFISKYRAGFTINEEVTRDIKKKFKIDKRSFVKEDF